MSFYTIFEFYIILHIKKQTFQLYKERIMCRVLLKNLHMHNIMYDSQVKMTNKACRREREIKG